jgi:hypothetical protein
VGKGISIDELDSPIKQANEASQDAKEDSAQGVTLTSFGLLRYGTQLSEAVDDGDDQASKTDTSERVGHASLESTEGGVFWEVV